MSITAVSSTLPPATSHAAANPAPIDPPHDGDGDDAKTQPAAPQGTGAVLDTRA